MKLFRRLLFGGGAAISLACCVTLIVFWVRSYQRIDVLDFFNLSPRYDYRITSNVGVIEFDRNNYAENDNGFNSWPISLGTETADGYIKDSSEAVWSFKIGRFAGGKFLNGSLPAEDIIVDVPDWVLAGAFAVLPAVWVFRRPRSHRNRCCGNCGYDLRATPDRCPECGTTPAKREVIQSD
jgi:hypothetical protein